MPEWPTLTVPGRVNLIGEHIDYHHLAVLPMAIQRRVTVAWQPLEQLRVIARSASETSVCDFGLTADLQPDPPGSWSNYVKAAARAIQNGWTISRGMEAAVSSNLPEAAGLSSSTALMTAVTLALLEANGIRPTFAELMRVLPEGEHFVGTRGGAMDHAVVLAASRGCALLVNFAPLSAEPIPIPPDWRFLVAHSTIVSKKSAGAREAYNRIRQSRERPEVARHVEGEVARVAAGVQALRENDLDAFGQILFESHASLRDNLHVSCAELDQIVEIARDAGAAGARLTGAGFGGCALVVTSSSRMEQIRAALERNFYSAMPREKLADSLFEVTPSEGALALVP